MIKKTLSLVAVACLISGLAACSSHKAGKDVAKSADQETVVVAEAPASSSATFTKGEY